MKEKQFPEGTKVTLTSGGAEMIIQGYAKKLLQDLSWDYSNAICVWQDKDNKPHAEVYHVNALKAI